MLPTLLFVLSIDVPDLTRDVFRYQSFLCSTRHLCCVLCCVAAFSTLAVACARTCIMCCGVACCSLLHLTLLSCVAAFSTRHLYYVLRCCVAAFSTRHLYYVLRCCVLQPALLWRSPAHALAGPQPHALADGRQAREHSGANPHDELVAPHTDPVARCVACVCACAHILCICTTTPCIELDKETWHCFMSSS